MGGGGRRRAGLIRFRLGARFRAALESHGAAALREEVLGVEDALGIEVDGVEISGGVLEDPVVPALTALVEGLADLAIGAAPLARVPFADGSIELFLARRGEEAVLSLVSLTPPARVLVRDLAVEFAPLLDAARRCARDILDALEPDRSRRPGAEGRQPEAAVAERRARALAHRRRDRHGTGPAPVARTTGETGRASAEPARDPADRLAEALARLTRARPAAGHALATGTGAEGANPPPAIPGPAAEPPGDPAVIRDALRTIPDPLQESPGAPTAIRDARRAVPDPLQESPGPPTAIRDARRAVPGPLREPPGSPIVIRNALPATPGPLREPGPAPGSAALGEAGNAPPPGRRPAAAHAPAFGFDLRDDEGRLSSWSGEPGFHALLVPGHVYVHGPDGEELLAVAGSPFLVLRELSREAFRLLRAAADGAPAAMLPLGGAPPLEVDLAGGAVSVAGRTLRCPPEAVARAAFQAALDLAGALLARNGRLAANPELASLIAESRERLALCAERLGEERAGGLAPAPPATPPRPAGAGLPLARGSLRRVALRLVWRSFLPPLRGMVRVGATAWFLTDEGVAGLDLHDGALVPGLESRGRVSLSAAGSRSPLLLLDGRGRLEGRHPRGAVAWMREDFPAGELALRYAKVLAPGGGRAGVARGAGEAITGDIPLVSDTAPVGGPLGVVLAEGRIVLGLALATGRTVFRLAPPGATKVAVAVAGPLAAAVADTGMVYALDASRGSLAWRVRLEHPAAAVAVSGDRLVVAGLGRDGVILHGFEARTGIRAFRVPVEVSTVGTLRPTRDGVVLAAAGPGGGEVLAVDRAGELRWRIGPFAGKAPTLAAAGRTLYARGAEEVCRIEGGERIWTAATPGPGGPPVICRDVVALPGERLALLDAARGREVPATGLPGELPAADHVLGSPEGILVVADREGATVGLRLAGALAVLPGMRPPPVRFPG
jgi:hypothetical protein